MKIIVKNFRSIRSQELEIAPITLIYGPNGTGKSSLLYALLTLKNIVLNPNQPVPNFFNFQFVNLGGLKEVVFDHDPNNKLELGISFKEKGLHLDYRVALKDKTGIFSLKFSGQFPGLKVPVAHRPTLEVSFPYPGNRKVELEKSLEGEPVTLRWTGLTWLGTAPPDVADRFQELLGVLNSPVELLKQVSFVPLARGFTQPQYTMAPVSPFLISDTEIASLLAMEKYLEYDVSHHLEKMEGKEFRVRFQPGTSIFSLDTLDRSTGVGVELVNEGFGINQVVYLLTKALHKNSKIVCIEEPEIHLHPGTVRRLARVLARIAKKERKHFLISTHSEPLVVAFLTLVAKGELPASDLACYLAVKKGKISRFERQDVNDKGQVKGGLRSFMEGELAEVKEFLGIQPEGTE
jgi:energy-coupling factor transporter ATP-binding protein EcfA2